MLFPFDWFILLWYLAVTFLNWVFICSAKHEYEGKWEGKTTRLTTCDPHAKSTVVNSNSPQEVEEGKEIIFTYDVEFQVSYWSRR